MARSILKKIYTGIPPHQKNLTGSKGFQEKNNCCLRDGLRLQKPLLMKSEQINPDISL